MMKTRFAELAAVHSRRPATTHLVLLLLIEIRSGSPRRVASIYPPWITHTGVIEGIHADRISATNRLSIALSVSPESKWQKWKPCTRCGRG